MHGRSVFYAGIVFPKDEMWKAAGFRSSEKLMFKHLWEPIDGPDSWDANPWVWVVKFKRINPLASN